MRRFSSLLKHDEISDSEGSAVMRLGMVLLGVAVILNVAVPQVASSQMKSRPGGTTPGGAIFDRLHDTTTRPMPPVPSSTAPRPEATWVPDRSVQVPGTDGPVFVPGHWERRLSDHEVYTRSEEHTSELQSPCNLVCRLLLEKKKKKIKRYKENSTYIHIRIEE